MLSFNFIINHVTNIKSIVMKTQLFTSRYFLSTLTAILFIPLSIIFQGCKKSVETSIDEEIATKRKPQDPPQPLPFYFTNCNQNPQYSATLIKGVAANVSITKNYVNSPGGQLSCFYKRYGEWNHRHRTGRNI